MLCAFLGCLGFTAGAEDAQITLKWDNPGAINVKVLGAAVDIAADATETTIVRDESLWATALVSAAPGYQLVSCTYTDDSGNTQNITLNNSKQFSIGVNDYNGRTFTITTKKLEMNDVLTIYVENGASKINEVQLTGTKTVLPSLTDGTNTFKFDSSVDKQLTLKPNNNQAVYKVTVDGKEVTRSNNNQPYTIDIANGTEINVRVYENDADAPQQLKVSFSETTPMGCIKSARNTTAMKAIDYSTGSFIVETGDKIRIYFNADWNVSAVTLNGTAVTLKTDFSGDLYVKDLTITEESVIDVKATSKSYTMNTMTAYITDVAGVELWAGNRLDGEKIELGEGEVVSEAVTLPAYTESGVSFAAYTVPAGTLKKYTFEVSTKYNTVTYYLNDGYWMRDARESSLKTSLSNPVSNNGFYLITEKIENDSEIVVYVDRNAPEVIFTTTGPTSGRSINLTEGYNTIGYDADYDQGFKFRLFTENTVTPTFVLNGSEVALRADENGIYSPGLKSGNVFKVYATSVQPFDVKFEAEEGAEAEVTYDKIVKLADLNSTVTNFNGTEFVIKPLNALSVALDGEALTPGEDGNYVFEADAAHTVTISKAVVYTFTPEPGQMTDALDQVIITFPEATSATRNTAMGDDEILFRMGWSWTSPVTVEAVEGAEHPSFAIKCQQAPVSKGTYTLAIPAGFFTVDGKTTSDIMASFEFSGVQTELVAEFSPEGNILAGEWLSVAVMFAEGQMVEIGETLVQNMSFSFTAMGIGEKELVYGTDFNCSAEGNMLLFDVTNTDVLGKAGSLVLSIGPGAFTVNGQASPEIYHMWNVVEPRTYEYVLTPDNNADVYDLSEIIIAINGADFAEISRPTGVSLRNGYGANAYYGTATLTEVPDAEVPTFKAVFDPKPATDGTYTLDISYSTFLIDGMTGNDPITKVYAFTTGVEDITVDADGDAAIFNLQGIRLETPWNELPAGIYIVGGHKVVK